MNAGERHARVAVEAGPMNPPAPGEFELIRRYFSQAAARPDVLLGVGDDAALLLPPTGEDLVASTDTLVAGRHFPLQTAAFDIGWKALAVNLSDLAAMGARPLWVLLALTLPQSDPQWLEGFAAGLQALAARHDVALVGGDTTAGPLSITITALGAVPAGGALRRSGARPGDRVCVSGTLGDAALALRSADRPGDADHDWLRTRLNRPEPRVAAGLALRGLANAAIDLSDGLAGDLGHILDASGVGAELQPAALPMSAAFARLHPAADRTALQAAGGDDYELCCCIPPAQVDAARAALARLALPLHDIGVITAEPGLRWLDAERRIVDAPPDAYRHFA